MALFPSISPLERKGRREWEGRERCEFFEVAPFLSCPVGIFLAVLPWPGLSFPCFAPPCSVPVAVALLFGSLSAAYCLGAGRSAAEDTVGKTATVNSGGSGGEA